MLTDYFLRFGEAFTLTKGETYQLPVFMEYPATGEPESDCCRWAGDKGLDRSPVELVSRQALMELLLLGQI